MARLRRLVLDHPQPETSCNPTGGTLAVAIAVDAAAYCAVGHPPAASCTGRLRDPGHRLAGECRVGAGVAVADVSVRAAVETVVPIATVERVDAVAAAESVLAGEA